MTRRSKVTPEQKINAVRDYLSGRASFRALAIRCGVHHSSIKNWITIYQSFGEAGLYDTEHNQKYPLELKVEAVESYLRGEGSLHDICRKYKLRTLSELQRWIIKYKNDKLK